MRGQILVCVARVDAWLAMAVAFLSTGILVAQRWARLLVLALE
jgi:hypothetical protein